MDWISNYQLFLFDFDGILVDTERLHYHSYQLTCREYKVSLLWDFNTYVRYAMYDAEGLKNALYHDYPKLHQNAPSWENFYKRKKENYLHLLKTEPPQLMSGVAPLLEKLAESACARCVVTNSSSEQVAWLKQVHPLLNTIPHWITREQYRLPKPSPECYEKAISLFAKTGDRIIGFEDSPRGLTALSKTAAFPVFVSSIFTEKERFNLKENIGSFFHVPDFQSLASIAGPVQNFSIL